MFDLPAGSTDLVPELPAELTGLDKAARLRLLLDEYHRRRRENRLAEYKPYPKQLEFHAQGLEFRERLFFALNQGGKTYAAAMEAAMHATGLYPDDWPGRRFATATNAWVGSISGAFGRDNAQRLLLGRPGEWGTGSIPKDRIEKIIRAQHSVTDAVDTIVIRHVSGGLSRIAFKSYEGGRAVFQGETLDWIWLDEECAEDIYTECLTRTNVKMGPVFMTFTPLKGSTRLVRRFMVDKVPGTAYVTMTIYDVGHISEKDREAIIASYPEHEREARTMGVPKMGSGGVFQIAEDRIRVKPFEIPDYWPRLCAIDFGWAHPTALVWWAFDRDTNTAYAYADHLLSKAVPAVHVAAWRAKGDWIPVAWPADGEQTEKGSGIQLAQQYRALGMKMLGDPALLPETNTQGENYKQRNSVEAGVQLMHEAMHTGKLKVFDTCSHLLEGIRGYYRNENGSIVKMDDDAVSAARYGYVMQRYAVTEYSARSGAYVPPQIYNART